MTTENMDTHNSGDSIGSGNIEGHNNKPRSHRRLLATGLTVGLLAGGSAGVIVGTPLFASAQGDSSSTTTVAPSESTEAPTTTADKAAEDAKPDSDNKASESTTTTEAPPAEAPNPAESDKSATPDSPKDLAKGDRRARMTEQMKQTLQGLVDSGTITQEQADKVIKAIEDSFAAMRDKQIGSHHSGGGRGFGEPGKGGFDGREFGRGIGKSFQGMRQAYEALGLSPAEIAQKLMDGKSLADIARDQGVDPQTLVDAITNPVKDFLDSRVADGSMTQQEADEHLADAVTRANEAINRAWGHHPGD